MDDKQWLAENQAAALRAHERDWVQTGRMFDSVIDYGKDALRAASLTAGGSVVVSLAFAGSIYGSDPETAKRLMFPVLLFACASLLSGTASGFGYLSQYYYTEALQDTVHTWKHPYLEPRPDQAAKERAGDVWRWASVLSVVGSYLVIIGGILAAWKAIS